MLPGKKYTPEDILQILWRYKWVLLVPFALISAGTAVYARYMPDRYMSQATIMVVPQRVPENYVRSAVTTGTQERLRSIREQVLSRTRLERVILELNLYPEQRRSGAIIQDVVEQMQRDVLITPGAADTFRVGFSGDNPVVVRKVAEKLTGMFIDESTRLRESLAEGTNQFLETQVAEAGTRLNEIQQRVEAYRRQYGAELPTQLESNNQAISNVQMEIQSLLQSINNNQNRRILLERQIADLEQEAQMPTMVASPDGAVRGTPAEQLAVARNQLTVLLQTKKPGHPDVDSKQREIAELEKKVEAEALRQPLGAGAALTPQERARQRRLGELKTELGQLEALRVQLQDEEKRLRGKSGIYQQRVENTPTRESQMIELTRDYGTLQALYASLLTKREDAKLSSNLERRQIGEQFDILDAARLPERPFSPNRRVYNYGGMAVGLVLGLALVALLEYRDRSFKTDDEVKSVLSLPVLAVVPLMRSDSERRRIRRRGVLVNFVLSGAVLTCLAILTYTFVR